ncbi:MAG: rRNA pseudouridine synthase [Fibrobacteres bacterium]|nr:rRNA pseudouridine synthase [Fibrobacterota bacterium]
MNIASLPRALSKLGFCSRNIGLKLIADGKISVNGKVCRNPSLRVDIDKDKITIGETSVSAAEKVYIALNKPRGFVTTKSDEKGRKTVFDLLDGVNVSHLSAVGRLDMASEGLLIFTNDTIFANSLTSPDSKVEKCYHVQIDRIPDKNELIEMQRGFMIDGETMSVKKAEILRVGQKNCWIEVILDEGRNRQIRRILAVLNINVMRLIRISIGHLNLGILPKGKWRFLEPFEIANFDR